MHVYKYRLNVTFYLYSNTHVCLSMVTMLTESVHGPTGTGAWNVLTATTDIQCHMKPNIVYGISQTVRPTTTDDIELQPNVLYGITQTARPATTDDIELQPNVLYGITQTARPATTDDIELQPNVLYGITQTARPTTTDDIELQPNVLYGVTGRPPDTGDQTNCENGSLGPKAADFEYMQI